MSVLAIAHAAGARGKPNMIKQYWETPLARQLKVNVDGSFYLEEREGAAVPLSMIVKVNLSRLLQFFLLTSLRLV
jgi:hypothetical protein